MKPVEEYMKLGRFAARQDHSKTLKSIETSFGWLCDKALMDTLGLKLQICVKPSRPMYLHGYLLTSALHSYLRSQHPHITILETGTARGFSAVAMALILDQNDTPGTIHTIDITPHNDPAYSNCLMAAQTQHSVSRTDLLTEWEPVTNKYITFLTGDSANILQTLELERVNFAFLDGAHDYQSVRTELKYVCARQHSGDVIICDDYTPEQFPGVCKAIDDFLNAGEYSSTTYFGNDGVKARGYVYLQKL